MRAFHRQIVALLVLLLALLGSAPATAKLPIFSRAGRSSGKLSPQTLRLIRGGVTTHKQLRQSATAVHMARSTILSDQVAAAKKYGDSWTCRSSTCLLIDRLAGQRLKLRLDSSGKNAFTWGTEGRVSYHYYGVDSIKRPTVLLDPTASTNFARDATPGGMLHGLLAQAGQKLGQPVAARRVARRIAAGGAGGLLVLANSAEIAVYKEALEQAAAIRARVQRNAERR